MKVTSNKTIDFPGLGWGIARGDEKELPKDKDAAEAIMAHPAIVEVGKSKSQDRREAVQKDAEKPKVEGEAKSEAKDK